MLFMKRTLRRRLARWEKQKRKDAEKATDEAQKQKLLMEADELAIAMTSDDIMSSLEDMVETRVSQDPDTVIFATDFDPRRFGDEDEDWVDKIIKLFEWIFAHQEEIQAFIRMLIELFAPVAAQSMRANYSNWDEELASARALAA